MRILMILSALLSFQTAKAQVDPDKQFHIDTQEEQTEFEKLQALVGKGEQLRFQLSILNPEEGKDGTPRIRLHEKNEWYARKATTASYEQAQEEVEQLRTQLKREKDAKTRLGLALRLSDLERRLRAINPSGKTYEGTPYIEISFTGIVLTPVGKNFEVIMVGATQEVKMEKTITQEEFFAGKAIFLRQPTISKSHLLGSARADGTIHFSFDPQTGELNVSEAWGEIEFDLALHSAVIDSDSIAAKGVYNANLTRWPLRSFK